MGGIRHGLFGTVAQRVIALGTTPVLLVPTPPRGDVPFSCRRLLVPLDGDANHERGLVTMTHLIPDAGARDAGASALLLMVIPTRSDLKQTQRIASRTLPRTTAEMLDASNEPAQVYLDGKAACLKNAGWKVTARVVRGEPVRAIAAASREFEADLIVLGTHGTRQLDAFWSESITPQLAHQARLPLLLVPVRDR
jgi:nucleotide-binding universal stress UspA family protein